MDWFPLSDELFQIATASKKEMLLIAANCYKKANECETEGSHNEEWLHFYMMGKVCEKMRTPPCEYLEHYKEVRGCIIFIQNNLNIQEISSK